MPFLLHAIFGAAMVAAYAAKNPAPEPAMPRYRLSVACRATTKRGFEGPG